MDKDPDANTEPSTDEQPGEGAWKVPAGGAGRSATDKPPAQTEASQASRLPFGPLLSGTSRPGASRPGVSRDGVSRAGVSRAGVSGGGVSRARDSLSGGNERRGSSPEFDLMRRQSDDELWKLLNEHRRALARARRRLVEYKQKAREHVSELKAAHAEKERYRRMSELAMKQTQEASRLKRIALLKLKRERQLRKQTVEKARYTIAKARRRYYEL